MADRANPVTRALSTAWYQEAIRRVPETAAAQDAVYRALALQDLYFLLVFVLGRKDVVHDWIFERVREVEKERNGYLDLWARGHYKSSAITFAMTIQEILRNPEITIGIFSYNRPIAKAFLRQIKREFESNEMLRRLFPDVCWENPSSQAPSWSEDNGITVRRRGNPKEATVEAWGLVDGQPTSKHYELMVYDDVVTAESVTTPDMIRKVTTAWETSRNLASENGVARYVGTRWSFNDTYKQILDRGAAIERRRTATVDGTPGGEPVLITRSALAVKRKEMGPYTYACQMLLNPVGDEHQGFKESWLRYSEEAVSGEGMNKYILVDAANAKKRSSDYTAIVVIGLGSDENYYLLDAVRDRLTLRERGDAVFALHRRWRPRGVGYEAYGLMADIDYLNIRMAEENYRFDIVKLGGQVRKEDRIKRLVPIFEEGRFILPPSLFKVDYEGKRVELIAAFLNEEYRAFPVSVHDDMFDAISRIMDEDLGIVWPKGNQREKEDRYAAPGRKRWGKWRKMSEWAA